MFIAADTNGAAIYQESGPSGSGPIACYDEDQTGAIPSLKDIPVWVGMPGGQHSGTQDCIMRYDVSEAYDALSPPDRRYWTWNDELTGLSLCVSTNGTGVNEPGRFPQPRYGPTGAKRGNCAGQICVNDTYVDSSKHKR